MLRAQVVVEGDHTTRARLPLHEGLDLRVVDVEDGGVVVVVDVLPRVTHLVMVRLRLRAEGLGLGLWPG